MSTVDTWKKMTASSNIRALVLRDYGDLVVESRERPEVAPDQVLIAVAATGICGSDLHGFTGENGRRMPGQIMGHESSGSIAALGAEANAIFAVGDVVTFNPLMIPDEDREEYADREQHCPRRRIIGVDPSWPAAFSDFVVVPWRNVVPLPGLADRPEMGALIEPLAVALHCVRRTKVGSDDRVVVLGGGPIGQSAVLAAQIAGVGDILVSEPQAARRELCRALGAKPIDPSEGDLLSHIQNSWGGPADIALDAVGISATLADAARVTRIGGTIGLVGMGSPKVDLEAYKFSTEERTLVGSFCYSHRDFVDAAEWVCRNPERLAPLISEIVEPEVAADAFKRLARGQEDIPGKILVRFSGWEQP